MGLLENQANLDGFQFGGGGDRFTIEKVEVDAPSSVTQDSPLILADGQAFGVDALGGRTVTFTGHVEDPSSPEGIFSDYAALVAAWNNPAIRLVPRAFSTLRYRMPGLAGTVVMYGRGRAIAPTLWNKDINLIQFIAAFATADPLMYDDNIQTITLGLAFADPGGGVTPPLTPPLLIAGPGGPQPGVAVNSGTEATWPVVTITGPVTNPLLTYSTRGLAVGLTGTLASGEIVILDTRPWNRSAVGPTGGSYAGRLTGNRLQDMALPVGNTPITFNGQDVTGSSSLAFTWRPASQIFASQI